MGHWLFKSEPTTFGIERLKHCKAGITNWNGVRNYQVRNMLRDEIEKGDLAFFYHSNCAIPAIVGMMKIIKRGYPDSSAWDLHSDYFDAKSSPDKPIWYQVDVQLMQQFKHPITLKMLRDIKGLEAMRLLQKGNRLSITSVTKKEWEIICLLAQ